MRMRLVSVFVDASEVLRHLHSQEVAMQVWLQRVLHDLHAADVLKVDFGCNGSWRIPWCATRQFRVFEI